LHRVKAPSIRRALTVRLLAGALMLLLAAGAVFFALLHQRLVSDFDRLLAVEAEALSHNAECKSGTIVWDLPDAYSTAPPPAAEASYGQLFLEDGTATCRSPTLGAGELPHLAGEADAVWNAPLPGGRRGRLMQKIFTPHYDDTEEQLAPEDPNEQVWQLSAAQRTPGLRLVLVVARSREGLDSLLRTLALAGGAVALLLCGALAWLVRSTVARGLRPVAELNAQITAISPDKLNTRLATAAPPEELASIETAVNRLLERLERAFENERHFSSDLAHELRTPIAELRTACEVAGRWPDDAAANRQFFHDARDTALHLEKLVATMLTLSRCESGALPVQSQPIGLETFVSQCGSHCVAAAARQLEFSCRIAPGLTVLSDADHLDIVLRNLLENAVVHSPPGTPVECTAARTADGVELRVVNSAPHLECADLARVFDRFWRKDTARTDRSRSGLGLAIAHELSTLLGLRLLVELQDDRRFAARLIFPAAVLDKGA